MADPAKSLEAEALKLPEKSRAELARLLLLSLEDSAVMDQETEIAWAEEAERRYEELCSGAVQAIASEEVFREARSRR